MKKIIKRIVSCVLFVAILLGLLQVSSLVFQPKSNDKASGIHYPRANGIFSEPKDSIDTVFIGDSEVYHSFIPLNIWRDYGITSYDVSSPSQKLVYSMEFLKKTFEKQSPKIVFLETNAIFRKSYLEDESHIRQSRFFLCSDIMTVGRIFSSRIFRLQLNILRMRINKGYYFTKKSKPATDKAIKEYMKYSDVSAPILSTNKKYLNGIAKFCEKHGAKLVLISTPSTKNWNYQRHNTMEAISKDLGVDYIDTNLLRDDIPIDWKKDTKDKGDHLNYNGAVKMTNYIGKYLDDTKLFKDKRNDPSYDNWNTCLDKFEKQVKKGTSSEN
mgnify:CR=1 FL=1